MAEGNNVMTRLAGAYEDDYFKVANGNTTSPLPKKDPILPRRVEPFKTSRGQHRKCGAQ